MVRRLSTEEFSQRAQAIHGMFYDYALVTYRNTHTPVEIICPIHGSFWQLPHNHMNGKGCKGCQTVHLSQQFRMNRGQFIHRSSKLHGGKYDYQYVEYVNNITPVIIVCPTHGKFQQQPANHLQGKGCNKCGNRKIGESLTYDTNTFIDKCKIVHGDTYDYSKTLYHRAASIVTIGCKSHGTFQQTANNHLSGKGCPKCNTNISQLGNAWLDAIGIPDTSDHREVAGLIPNRRYIVDGYDPKTNTIYEFHGDYWHGNPNVYKSTAINKTVNKPFGQLYKNTTNKRQAFQSAGYTYVEIWESNYIEEFNPDASD